MYTNVHCSTVYNSKDLEPTQMPIDDRLDRENVAHKHHGILCSPKNWSVHVLCRDMDESGNHHSQRTDTRRENQKPHVLIGGCWTMRTHGQWEGSITHWGLLEGTQGGTAEGRELGRDNMGRNARSRWWGGRQQTTLPCMCLCNNLACSSHVPQNLKHNKILIFLKMEQELIYSNCPMTLIFILLLTT